MIVLLLAAARAAPSDAPWLVPVEMPAAGPVRVRLPPEAAAVLPAEVEAGMSLVDAAGNPIPFFALSTSGSPPPATEDLGVAPTAPGAWRIGAASGPVHSFRLAGDIAEACPCTASVDGGPTTTLYALGDRGIVDVVPVPGGSGPFALEVRPWRAGAQLVVTGATGIRRAPGAVDPHLERVEVGPPVAVEGGTVRYAVHLGGTRLVNAVNLDVGEIPAFSRTLRVGVPAAGAEPEFLGEGPVERWKLLGLHVDATAVGGFSRATDRLLLDVATERGSALPVRGVDVVSAAIELVAVADAAGPAALYLGGGALPVPRDLSGARAELLDVARVALAGAMAPNPAYAPLEDRAGLGDVGSEIPVTRFAWTRPIGGPAGWVVVPLDRHVLAAAEPSLGDLRIVDAQDRQVPFTLRRTGREVPVEATLGERTEVAGRSRLRIALGEVDAPIETLVLVTSQPVFEREVTLLVDQGTQTWPIRAVRWSGGEGGGTLAIRVGSAVGRSLLVEIANGDNPPLPVDAVSVTAPEWELRARLPAEGARLLYGAPGVGAPSYDLGLVAAELAGRALPSATLGEPARVAGPQVSAVERAMVTGALAALAIGLAALVVRVLRGTPEPA